MDVPINEQECRCSFGRLKHGGGLNRSSHVQGHSGGAIAARLRTATTAQSSRLKLGLGGYTPYRWWWKIKADTSRNREIRQRKPGAGRTPEPVQNNGEGALTCRSSGTVEPYYRSCNVGDSSASSCVWSTEECVDNKDRLYSTRKRVWRD